MSKIYSFESKRGGELPQAANLQPWANTDRTLFSATFSVTRPAVQAASRWRLCLRFLIVPVVLSWSLTGRAALPETGPDFS